MGAPGLASETWESVDLKRSFSHPHPQIHPSPASRHRPLLLRRRNRRRRRASTTSIAIASCAPAACARSSSASATHVGCPNSGSMRDELSAAIASGATDPQVLSSFSAKYGVTVLAAPPAEAPFSRRHGLHRSANLRRRAARHGLFDPPLVPSAVPKPNRAILADPAVSALRDKIRPRNGGLPTMTETQGLIAGALLAAVLGIYTFWPDNVFASQHEKTRLRPPDRAQHQLYGKSPATRSASNTAPAGIITGRRATGLQRGSS